MPSEQSPHTSRTKLILNVAIGALVVVALVLGYFVYAKYFGEVALPESVSMESEADTSTTSDAAPGDAALPELSEDERAALTPPGPDATEAERQEHFSLVQNVAVNDNRLLVGADCSTYPSVMRTRLGTELTFLNRDSEQHVITFNEEHSYILPPGEPVTLSADFGQGAGLYGYGCDRGTTAAGMMLVAE